MKKKTKTKTKAKKTKTTNKSIKDKETNKKEKKRRSDAGERNIERSCAIREGRFVGGRISSLQQEADPFWFGDMI